ncbi:MAG: hypothetical protein AUG51_19315 [Acidobacteria bacterium 13_1_20CM_3_53_8]|nr:MAG: hypothetical protein AUG51_19315 [Acidobacteria bacterium 13_1_20CM_3_53_8]
MREFKSTLPGSVKGIDGRIVTGICAVFGNVDYVRDRIKTGAFKKTIKEAGRMAKHLWNHSGFEPPIAVIRTLQEVGRDGLPDEVLKYAPDAMGGLEVAREYLNTPRADEVLEGISKGAINQMSFGYDTVKIAYTEEGEGVPPVRELLELKLYDTSDVNWGCNDATVGSKTSLQGQPLEAVLQQLALHVQATKADQRRLPNPQTIHALVKAALDFGWDGIIPSAFQPSTDTETSRAEEEQGAADEQKSDDPSLTEIGARLQELNLFQLSL